VVIAFCGRLTQAGGQSAANDGAKMTAARRISNGYEPEVPPCPHLLSVAKKISERVELVGIQRPA
jgi:hypothetical protein